MFSYSTLYTWVLNQEDETPSDDGRCGVGSSQKQVSCWHNHVLLMKCGVLVGLLLLQMKQIYQFTEATSIN